MHKPLELMERQRAANRIIEWLLKGSKTEIVCNCGPLEDPRIMTALQLFIQLRSHDRPFIDAGSSSTLRNTRIISFLITNFTTFIVDAKYPCPQVVFLPIYPMPPPVRFVGREKEFLLIPVKTRIQKNSCCSPRK